MKQITYTFSPNTKIKSSEVNQNYTDLASFTGARAYNSAGQVVADSTTTVLLFDSESFDSDTYHSTSVNTGRLTVPGAAYAGVHHIYGINGHGADADGWRQIQIRLNGTTTLALQVLAGTGATAQYYEVQTYYALANGDYVELVFNHTAGNNLTTVGGIGGYQFGIARLGNTPS